MPVILNFAEFRAALLAGADDYLAGQQVTGDADGFFHGPNGRKRALLLKAYVETISEHDHYALLALARFAFYNTERLKGLIGERMIQGGMDFYASDYGPTASFGKPATSKIFNMDTPYRAPLPHFHAGKAAKRLLDAALLTDYSVQIRDMIIKSSKRLETAAHSWIEGESTVNRRLLPEAIELTEMAAPAPSLSAT